MSQIIPERTDSVFRGVENVVFRETFTGDGGTKEFQLTSAVENATFSNGSWNAINVQVTFQHHITGTDSKPIYDSLIPITRHRIAVTSIDNTGLITLDYAPRSGISFYIWYWYRLEAADSLSNYYREDFVADMEEETTGLIRLPDTNSSNYLTLNWNEDDNADRIINFKVNAANRAITLYDDLTIPLDAYKVELDELETATYDDVQDWFDITQSAGIISGGEVTSDGDGSITVAAGTGMIRSTISDIGDIKFFDWAEDTSLTPNDGVDSYICLDYNSGTPQARCDTSSPANGQTIFLLCHVFRKGNAVYVADMGTHIPDFLKQVQKHHLEDTMLDIVSGGIVTETGTRYLEIETETVAWLGLNRETFSAIDTSGVDDFELYYNDGSWQESSASQLGNSQYNNYGVGLASLTTNKFGLYWVYMDYIGKLLVLYGTLDGTFAAAVDEGPPANLPPHIVDWSVLIAKIIFQQGQTNFTAILSTLEQTLFSPSGMVVHNETTVKQGGQADEYYHDTELYGMARKVAYFMS